MDDESWQLGFKPGIWSWFSIFKSNNAILHKGEKHRPSVEIENSFGKNQHPLTIKSLSKLEIEFSHPDRQLQKPKSTSHTALKDWLGVRKEGQDFLSTFSFSLVLEILQVRKAGNFIKGIEIKERKKAFYSQETGLLSYLASLLLWQTIDQPKITLGRKDFILAYRLWSVIQGSQGRNLKTQTEAQTMVEKHYLLACSFWLTKLAFLYGPGPSVYSWYHPQQAGHQISTKTMPHRQAHRPSWWRQVFSWSSFFPGVSNWWWDHG